jgi:hypothetical protein
VFVGVESWVLLAAPVAVVVTGTIIGFGGTPSDSVNFALIKDFPVGTGGGT